jgi:precorrin-2/cobalt-factor-2 C20-methyltransferase
MRRLIGVGVGPGDPELITVKGRRIRPLPLTTCSSPVLARLRVRRTTAAEAAGRARGHRPRARRGCRADPPAAFAPSEPGGVTAGRAAAWDAAAAAVAGAFAAGARTVAFATIGDPAIYSTFSYLAQTVTGLAADVTIETVPGITAASDLAARSGTTLTEGTESLLLLPLTAGTDALAEALARHDTVVGYKLGSAAGPGIEAVLWLLAGSGRLQRGVRARARAAGEDIRLASELVGSGPVPYPVPRRSQSVPRRAQRAGGSQTASRAAVRRRGPGAPDLLTLRAVAAIGRPDRGDLGLQPGRPRRAPARQGGRRDRRLGAAAARGSTAVLPAGPGRARAADRAGAFR